MSTYDLMYAVHAVRDAAHGIWQSSPELMVIIGCVLTGVVYFSFKR